MSDVEALLVVVALLFACGLIVAWVDHEPDDRLRDTRERREMQIRSDRSRRWEV